MEIWIKNTDSEEHTYSGQTILSSEYYMIEQDVELDKWQNNSQLLSDIGSGIAVVARSNSGTDDITDINLAINYLKGLGTQEVKIIEQVQSSPFASKILENGKKLYAREHGVPKITIAAGSTQALVFEVPYAACKITGASIVGCQKGDTCNFKILDTDAGLLTTIPLYPVNQFGYDVNMPDGVYNREYNYDADLFLGLHVSIEYTNNGDEAIDISANLELHEVKD